MAKYECKVCGYIYNEQHASRTFDELTECPICNEGKENFIALDAEGNAVEAQTQVKADKADVLGETDANNIQEKADTGKQEDDLTEDTAEFVVERRQEFWTPVSANPVKETASANTTGWTISNAMGNMGSFAEEADKEEQKETVIDKLEDEEMPVYESRIESFYSSAESVGASHIISGDEEDEHFKPLWNNGGGTVQRVIDPFGDKNDAVVKAENIGMVVPAEEPVVEEILGEEAEEVTAEANREDVLEDVKEYFFDDEEAVEETEVKETAEEFDFEEVTEANEATEEFSFEEVAEAKETTEEFGFEEVTEAKETEEEFSFEEVAEAKETAEEFSFEEEAKDTIEEFGFEEVTETEEATGTAVVNAVIDEEDDDDDFFTEMTMDAVVDNAFDGEVKNDSGISEEEVFKAIAAIRFDEDVPEGGKIEVVTADGTEEIYDLEAEEEFFFEEVAEPAEEVAESASESVEEAVENVAESAEEVAESASESVEEAVENVAEPVEEVAESASESVEEVAEDTAESATVAEEPRVKAWSFMDDVLEAEGAVSGVTYISKAMDEVVEEEVTADDIEEVFVDFAEDDKEVTGETEATSGAELPYEPVADKKEDVVYCNNLENILIVPAQLNPMPLPEGTEVQGKTILGIASDRPLVLENPVFSTGAYNMVQYIPNSGLTSEDYQRADAIEIIVGHGNGIEKTINSKEDLRQVVNFLRLESDGCPIGIKMGAARIERDLEFCVFAKPDYVVLNNFNVVPLPYALHRATKYLNTVQSDMDIVIALDGAKDAEELAKIMAMGADVIALRNKPANMKEMMEDLKHFARITGHYDVEDLNVKDLCTIDREIARFTDIYHV